jgi:phenylalanyl-tRNA synthetase beta chain
MGGLETEVSESTVKLLLDSANFKAARIRKTATRLDLRTDASQRFEKSQPPSNVKVGIARILKLIEDSGADLKVISRFTVDGDLQEAVRYIDIPAGRLEQLAGITLPPKKVTEILESLGFTTERKKDESLKVAVPAFRSQKDISIPEDIVEEVLRVFGFDNIPPMMPSVPVKPLHVEKQLKMEHKIRRILSTAHKFLEVHNYVWYNDNWLKTLNYDPGETLVLENPTTPETSRLRTTLIPNLLALVSKNRPFKESFRLFEIGRTFGPVEEDTERCLELSHLGGVAFQRVGSLENLYLSVKSAIDNMLVKCGIQNAVFKESSVPVGFPWTSEGNFVDIICNEHDRLGPDCIGRLGILDKNMTAKVCREGGQVVWFEIYLNELNSASTLYSEEKFEEPPKYPLSWQDFSLLWNIKDGFDKLESILDKFANPLVIRREFVESYKGKGLEKEQACYSFRFWIGSPDHTLSGEEIETFHQQFLAYIKEKGIALRT